MRQIDHFHCAEDKSEAKRDERVRAALQHAGIDCLEDEFGQLVALFDGQSLPLASALRETVRPELVEGFVCFDRLTTNG